MSKRITHDNNNDNLFFREQLLNIRDQTQRKHRFKKVHKLIALSYVVYGLASEQSL